jgi:hypothetical protein
MHSNRRLPLTSWPQLHCQLRLEQVKPACDFSASSPLSTTWAFPAARFPACGAAQRTRVTQFQRCCLDCRQDVHVFAVGFRHLTPMRKLRTVMSPGSPASWRIFRVRSRPSRTNSSDRCQRGVPTFCKRATLRFAMAVDKPTSSARKSAVRKRSQVEDYIRSPARRRP